MSQKTKAPLSFNRLARTYPYSMVILSGIMLVLSFPPFPFAFLAYFAFVPLLLVMDQTPDKIFEDRLWFVFKTPLVTIWRVLIWPVRAILWLIRGRGLPKAPKPYRRKIISRYAQIFRYAYTAFLIWNLGVGYFIMLTALGVEDIATKMQALSAGLMANLLNPFLMAIPIYLFARLRRASDSFWMSFSFVAFWLAFEWLHFHWELSWSWLTLGHSQTFFPGYIQYIEYTGVLGISALILLSNVLLYQLFRVWEKNRRLAFYMAGGLLILLLLPLLMRPLIMNESRAVFQPSGTLNVRAIQPNIDPYEKFGGTYKQQVETFARLILMPGVDTIDLAMLPETAIPRPMWNDRLRRERLIQPLWDIVQEYDISLLSGLTELRHFDPDMEKIPVSARFTEETGYYEYYNASALLRKDTVPQTFQKGKLVPMVERMPYLEYLAFLKDYQIDLGGSFGNYGKPVAMHTLKTHTGAEIASLVCYESEYGDYIRPLMRQGASIITVITNDGWWNFDNSTNERSGSSGHIQHAHFSVLRAIEARREVARSANTGISLFTDVYGHIHNPTEYWGEAYTDRRCNLYEGITFYVKHGDYLGWISGILSLILIAFFLMKGRHSPQPKANE